MVIKHHFVILIGNIFISLYLQGTYVGGAYVDEANAGYNAALVCSAEDGSGCTSEGAGIAFSSTEGTTGFYPESNSEFVGGTIGAGYGGTNQVSIVGAWSRTYSDSILFD